MWQPAIIHQQNKRQNCCFLGHSGHNTRDFMSAPNREQFANNASTTLASSANTSTTSLSLSDGSSFPSTGNFRLLVGTEIMLATVRSSNTVTVMRGQESTTAASHTGGDDVTHVLTSGALQQTGADNVPLWGAMPALNTLNGLSASDFTVVDSSVASSLSDSAGGLVFTKPATSGLDHSVAVIISPSAPYSYIAAIQLLIPSTSGISSGGMTLYKASSGEHYGLEVGMNNNVNGYQFWKVVKYSEMPVVGQFEICF
jgi:hypothetical protein